MGNNDERDLIRQIEPRMRAYQISQGFVLLKAQYELSLSQSAEAASNCVMAMVGLRAALKLAIDDILGIKEGYEARTNPDIKMFHNHRGETVHDREREKEYAHFLEDAFNRIKIMAYEKELLGAIKKGDVASKALGKQLDEAEGKAVMKSPISGASAVQAKRTVCQQGAALALTLLNQLLDKYKLLPPPQAKPQRFGFGKHPEGMERRNPPLEAVKGAEAAIRSLS